MTSPVRRFHRWTYESIYRRPVSSQFSWQDIRSMLGTLAEVAEEPDGNLTIRRNGQTLVLLSWPEKQVAAIEELMDIHRFLERSSNAALPNLNEAVAHPG